MNDDRTVLRVRIDPGQTQLCEPAGVQTSRALETLRVRLQSWRRKIGVTLPSNAA